MPAVLRRGPGTKQPLYAQGIPPPFYSHGVHQDYGLTPDEYQMQVTAYGDEKYGKEWRTRFDDESVKGMTLLCLWRPVHMQQPV